MIILGPDPNKKAILITAILFFFNTYKFKIPLDKSSLVKRKSGAKKRSLFGWMGYFRKEISCKIKNCWYNSANHMKAVKERVGGARPEESIRLVKGCGRRG